MAEYYRGKDVTVRFEAFKDGKPVRPSGARVEVYLDRHPTNLLLQRDLAETTGTEVVYTLPGKYVVEVGQYIFVFDVTIPKVGNFPHILKVKVRKSPVK